MEAPPHAQGGTVDVRVVNAGSKLAGTLPAGYRYGARTVVHLVPRLASPAVPANEGDVAIRLEAPPDAHVGRISFRLDISLFGNMRWIDAAPGAGAQHAGRTIETRPDPGTGIWIDVSPGRSDSAAGDLVVAHWHSVGAPAGGVAPTITINAAHVSAPNGQPIDVEVQSLTLPLPPNP